ncbi:hypothetical protein DHEL01_v209137 [Diaporthe helianthi]|uniref:Uncharacterized protein n=1 Tax=Diaporthe helianthi TaxID=158607 RepID=A0A2P5HQC1_DIAHE|nr:hypothetical protein DHEL01_v209137 [Diaporthe helianthi]
MHFKLSIAVNLLLILLAGHSLAPWECYEVDFKRSEPARNDTEVWEIPCSDMLKAPGYMYNRIDQNEMAENSHVGAGASGRAHENSSEFTANFRFDYQGIEGYCCPED